ncbi:MAG: hypothetical protein Q7U75_05440 [Desulfobacterales bacterium]|nr:hypothetical protein [Desulfobacterales bacterium]
MNYLGYDVLELNYNRVGAVEERLHRKFVLLNSKTGKRTSDEQSPAPAATRPFTWTAIGRAEIAAMRTFLDARIGRAVPFWLPSFQWDLALAEDVRQNQSTVTIRWVRYRQQMWGTTGVRRQLAFWSLGDGSMDYYRIADATDPANNLTETLTLNPAAVRDYTLSKTVLSFLKLCRLEDDQVEISYPSPQVAEATIRVRELPLEAPL